MRRFIALTLLTASLCASTAVAQSSIVTQEVRSGQTYEVILTPQDIGVQKVSLWMLSPKNNTLPVQVSLQGPAGLKATLQAKQIARQNMAAQGLASDKGWWKLPKGTKTLAAVSAPPALPAVVDYCELLSEDEIAELLVFYSILYGRTVTREELCSGSLNDPGSPGDPYNPDYPDGGDSANEFTAILLKDSCKASKKSFYLIKLDLDLTSVDRTQQQENIVIQATMTAKTYKGSQQSSLKPVSEGRFAPAPLLLMRALGGGFMFGGVSEKMYLNKWRKGLPKKNLYIRTPQYLYYRGMIFVEGLPGGYLRGGKATATVSNSATGYSICLGLDRRRQKFNGYP